MGAARITVMVVALVAAIGVAFLMRGTILNDKGDEAQSAASAQPMAQVLVATKDLPIGAQIQAGDVAWEAWPAKSLNATFITNGADPAPAPSGGLGKVAQGVQNAATGSGQMEALYGSVVRDPIFIGEPITARKIVRGGQGGYLSVVLQPGMRAMGVTVNVETGAGGFILPGDRVDILQSQETIVAGEGGSATRVTRVVVQNVKVLAIDQKTAPEGEAKTVVGAVATLEVPANAAAALVDAKSRNNPLFMVLRSYADLGGPSGVVGIAALEQSRPASVRVFRNGQVSEVAVAQ